MSMFGNLGNLAGMMKDFQNLKQKAEVVKQELAAAEFTASSIDGSVRITMSGTCEVKKVTYLAVAPSQEAVAEAMNAALALVKQEISKKISEATGGIPLPGFF